MEKLGTDDDELQNIADLIIKKAIRKKSQVGRLVIECSNLIEKKPLFRNIFLQNLQKSHQERKAIKKDSRENFIGLIMLLTEGKCQHLMLPIGKKYPRYRILHANSQFWTQMLIFDSLFIYSHVGRRFFHGCAGATNKTRNN